MDIKQENHLQYIKDQFQKLVDIKYRAGAAEHGGTLESLTVEALINNAIDEAIDQIVYLVTVRDVYRREQAERPRPVIVRPQDDITDPSTVRGRDFHLSYGYNCRCILPITGTWLDIPFERIALTRGGYLFSAVRDCSTCNGSGVVGGSR